MRAGYINFDYNTSRGPNIINNPLPNHLRPKINVLMEDSTRYMKTRVNDVKMSMADIYRALIQAKVFQPRETKMI